MNISLMEKIMHIKKSGQRGYTLLFAVLISALVLGVGVSILNIARKELLLNSSARESQYAFYAADTGYECAVYWDSQGAFASSSPFGTIKCGTITSTPTSVASSTVTPSGPSGISGNAYVYTFSVPIAGKACAIVKVTKDYQPVASLNNAYAATTEIFSRGYNVGWNPTSYDCSTANTSKVERALLVSY